MSWDQTKLSIKLNTLGKNEAQFHKFDNVDVVFGTYTKDVLTQEESSTFQILLEKVF